MNIEELVERYYFHDSLIENILYIPDQNKVVMLIDFCFWLQPSGNPGSKETGMIELTFSEVELYKNQVTSYESDSILEVHAKNNEIVFCNLNDSTQCYYEVVIKAQAVTFKKLSN